ncbi:MAG TPA: hypothetical protein PLK02_06910 [Paludibacteraceae bacterium]|nr:hypothetical protein [Paludibacteraceae bacterium]
MIWSNKAHCKKEKEFPFGKINVVELGESGRGRKLIVLPSEVDIQKGLNPDITIGLSKSGKPRINRFKDDKLFLIIDTADGYTRRGDGEACIHRSCMKDVKVLSYGNGADGLAGRIGIWEVFVIEVLNNNTIWLEVTLSGGGNSDVYKIDNKTVKYVGRNEDQGLSLYQDTTGDIIPGFTNDEEGLKDYFSLEQMFTA